MQSWMFTFREIDSYMAEIDPIYGVLRTFSCDVFDFFSRLAP